jgi:hypothetical protein
MTPICNGIVVSDMHICCRLGLCPPSGLRLDDGGTYSPSPTQRKVWDMWEEFWRDWVPQVTRGEPYCVIVNGDAVDGGAHHNNVTHISANKEDQERMALDVMRPVRDLCEGRLYWIRGTEAHSGQSGCDEEGIARQLGAVPDADGRHARWELWIELGTALVHATHHIGTTGSLAYETTAIHKELEQAFVESGRWGERHPDVIVRSHRHRNAETRIQTARGFATSFVTAGWQLKTPFAHRVAGARQTMPQIGGSLIRCGDEDVYTRHKLWKVGRPSTEKPVEQDNRAGQRSFEVGDKT